MQLHQLGKPSSALKGPQGPARPGFPTAASTRGCGLWWCLPRGCGRSGGEGEVGEVVFRYNPFFFPRPGAVPRRTTPCGPWAVGEFRTHSRVLGESSFSLNPRADTIPAPRVPGAEGQRQEQAKHRNGDKQDWVRGLPRAPSSPYASVRAPTPRYHSALPICIAGGGTCAHVCVCTCVV